MGRGDTVVEEVGETDIAMGEEDCDDAGDGVLGGGGNGPRTVDGRGRRGGGGGKDLCATADLEMMTFFLPYSLTFVCNKSRIYQSIS